MPERFALSCKWLNRKGDTPFDRAFAASINISVDGRSLTRLFSELDNEVRNDMRGCAWQLAQWFAANWWRLRWEAHATQTQRNNVDWGMSHCVASAGGGFIWPDIVFDSDGESIGISLSPDKNPPPYQPVQYLNEENTYVPAEEFERSVDNYLSAVIARGTLKKDAHDGSLKALWDEVLNERRDPDASRYRKWEAIAGYGPDEAPKALMAWILKASQRYGQSASEEVAAQARHESVEAFEALQKVSKRSGVIVSMPVLTDDGTVRGCAGELPWQKAEQLARSARREWGLGSAPVSEKQLAGLVGASGDEFFGSRVAKVSMPFLLRDGRKEEARLFLPRKPATSRRFAVSRLIGDNLYADGQDRLLPATNAQTIRQKFQRAFAQAFLCPFDALQDKLGTDVPDDDDIADAADYFKVSPLLVRTVLVNKGMLGRGMLNQQAG